jgi:rhodanese-related sulfurtransferase
MDTITRTELQTRIDRGDVVVVETLGPQHFEDAHLPGAVNIPHTEVARLAPELLPDKDATVVTYCSNTACQNSHAAAAELTALGYRDVRRYVEGKQDWTEAGLQSSAAPPSRPRTHEGRAQRRGPRDLLPEAPHNLTLRPPARSWRRDRAIGR